MQKIARVFIGLVVFVASYAILTFLVVPLLTQKGGSKPLDEAALARFPVVVVIQHASGAANPSFAVAQMRELQSVTTKAASYSFLLPAGSNKIVDQDGDPASYTADNISPGRQRIQLRAMVGDYTHDAEYEAEDKKVFPLRVGYTGPQAGVYTIPTSALLTWLVLWLTRGRQRRAHRPGAGNSK
jgi:hypothetical protein